MAPEKLWVLLVDISVRKIAAGELLGRGGRHVTGS